MTALMQNVTRRDLYDILYAFRIHRVIPDKGHYLGAILSFHRVYEDRCPYRMPSIRRLHVSRGYLERLVEYYRGNGYEFVSLDRVYDVLTQGEPMGRFISITFDDGYRDNREIAYPLLKKHGIPFTIYISSGNPQGRNVNWPFMLDDLVSANDRIAFSHLGRDYMFRTGTAEDKRRAYLRMVNFINDGDIGARRSLLEAIFSPYGFDIDSYSKDLFLSWDEIRELSRSGLVTIGSHTVNHYELARLASDDVLTEIRDCRRTIEQEIGKDVAHFAYPFGCRPAVGEREFQLAKRCGFKTCTSTAHGYIRRGQESSLERLPRVVIHEDASLASIDVRFNSAVDGLLKGLLPGARSGRRMGSCAR